MPKKTVALLVEQHNDYLIRVKGNQAKLYQGIETIVANEQPICSFRTYERTRNRQTERQVWLYNQIGGLDPGWRGLQQVVVVQRSGWRGAEPYHDLGYYITSLSGSAQELGELIRGHWAIENRLHYVKDVVFEEDTAPMRQGQAPQKFSVLRNWVINIFRKNNMGSLTSAIRQVAHDLDAICKLIE